MRLRSVTGLVTLGASLIACSSAPPPPPVGQPANAPPPTLTPSAAPTPAAQAFAEDEVTYVFTDPERRKKIESAFPDLDALAEAELRESKVPGFVLGVVVDGELVHAKGFGYADVEKKTKADADTIYPVASISKSFTALATLALRDEGALSLEDPITRWLPEANGLVYPTRDTPPITLRQLLTHTSGLPRIGRFERARYDHPISEEEITRSLPGYALEGPPGTMYWYSNLGFGLLGLAVGRASHASLRAVVGKHLLEPLGMTSTGYDREKLPAARLATHYRKNASGTFEPVPVQNQGALVGGRGLHTSMRDMTRYLALQLSAYPSRSDADTGPVRRSSVREAHFDQRKAWRIEVKRAEAAADASLVTASTTNYGFGWAISESCDFDRLVWHNGGAEGYYAWVGFLPESGVGVMTFTSYMGGPDISKKVLLALKKSGGLSRRVPQMKRLSPALEAVMPKFLAVFNTWNEEGYKAMLTVPRFVPIHVEKEELGGYRKIHGACTGYAPIEIPSPTSARFAMKCERGSLEMQVSISQSDGLIAGFGGVSRDIPPLPKLAGAADRLAGLIGKWDEGVYRKHLAPKASRPKAETEARFAALRTRHGACKVKSFLRRAGTPELVFGCERGEDLKLTLALDEKSRDVISSYAIDAQSTGVCPAK